MSLPVFFSVHQTPSEKGSTLKGKNLLRGANSFLIELIPFLEGSQNDFDRVASLKVCLFPLESTIP